MLVTRAWIHMMAVKQFLYVCAYGTVSVYCRIFNCIKQNFTFFAGDLSDTENFLLCAIDGPCE